MIRARHKRFFVAFFDHYSRWMIRWHFRKAEIFPRIEHISRPVLLIGNHFSWWDGFIACYLNREVFHKKLHVMMLEEQLRPRMFLNKAGAYSIRPGTRDAMKSLSYSADLLGSAENLVVMYPQGEFESIYRYPVQFNKGIERIAVQARSGFKLIYYVALIDYFSFRKPVLSIYLEQADPEVAFSSSRLESDYNRFMAECKNRQIPSRD